MPHLFGLHSCLRVGAPDGFDHVPGESTVKLSSSAATGIADGRITIIVPVNNRIVLARPVFTALAREIAEDGDAEVVVVNQMSSDGVDDIARSAGFTVIDSHAETAGGLRNVGVRGSHSTWLCFVDSDVLVPVGYLRRLREALAAYPDDLLGCNYGLPLETTWTERNWHLLTYEAGSGARRWLNAGNIALNRTLFDRSGGFDESLTSGEDTEFCSRVLLHGSAVRQLESLTAAHLGNPKSLRSFFGKQIWHGQGASITNGNSLAALGHGAALLISVAILLITRLNVAVSVGVLLMANAIPLAAWMHLKRKRGNNASLLASVANLHCYFLARFVALFVRSGRQR